VRKALLLLDDALEVGLQHPVARQQVVDVAVQEAVVPQELGHVLQVAPAFVQRGLVVVRHLQAPLHLLLEAHEDGVDDVVLVAEVVVEIAGADLHGFRNRRGGDVGFADFVEQAQRDVEDAVPGAAGAGLRFRFHGRPGDRCDR
jgi:hypothetical protein